MIRSFEKTQSTACLSSSAARNGRIPIFAVSASLVEKERQKYIDSGFDGWILKPVDFKRVEKLLKGMDDDNLRNEDLYQPGKWEQGGWFASSEDQKSIYDTLTKPSGAKPVAEAERMTAEGRTSDPAPSEGSLTPRQGPVSPPNDGTAKS